MMTPSRRIPPDFQKHLNGWSPPITPEAYVEVLGDYWLTVGYAEIFWPDFQLIDDHILRPGITREAIDMWKDQLTDRASMENMLNHFHLAHIHFNASLEGRVTADACIYLGEVLAEAYAAKLALQFPDRPCEVSFFRPDDREDIHEYQITFWQKN
ncbi:hypothetical protein [Pontivivens ytuae]|uniref:Uncharacterized protein n=1 Tax=Pontivivens ytuae TaxID=2789856 RepID=A0A7S9QC91_9RHOB|nr:hypothetical protein [Pontivivens ytuae]QPH53943.1 hypothetical protein I0K15_19575 [Pontivivens ytuae]